MSSKGRETVKVVGQAVLMIHDTIMVWRGGGSVRPQDEPGPVGHAS